MNWSGLQKKIKYYSFFLPLRWYGLLFSAALLLVYVWLKAKVPAVSEDGASSFGDIIGLLLKVALVFVLILLMLALLSVLIPYVVFLWQERKKKIQLLLKTRLNDVSTRTAMHLQLQPIWQPLFGFLRLRLIYDDKLFTPKFSLTSESSAFRFFKNQLAGNYYWQLPATKEYQVHNCIVYFEDIFQIFSFAVQVPVDSQFFTKPQNNEEAIPSVLPRKTENEETRIEELRRVQGEYLNYKNFEDHDDVRRIVWKIYAKNKELVVRIPETLSPYASHIYLYASFHTHFNTGEVAEVPMLNYFKAYVWRAFQQLQTQGFEVRYMTDQELNVAAENVQERVLQQISLSNWHKQNELTQFVQPNNAAVAIVHSLTHVNEVKQLMSNSNCTILFVPLTDALKVQNIGDWVKWIFVQAEEDELSKYRMLWNLTANRSQILENEKAIRKVLGGVMVN